MPLRKIDKAVSGQSWVRDHKAEATLSLIVSRARSEMCLIHLCRFARIEFRADIAPPEGRSTRRPPSPFAVLRTRPFELGPGRSMARPTVYDQPYKVVVVPTIMFRDGSLINTRQPCGRAAAEVVREGARIQCQTTDTTHAPGRAPSHQRS